MVVIPEDGFPNLNGNDAVPIREHYQIVYNDMLSYLQSAEQPPLADFQRYIRTHTRRTPTVAGGEETLAAWATIYQVFLKYTVIQYQEPQSQRLPIPAQTVGIETQADTGPWVFEGDAASSNIVVESNAEECVDSHAVHLGHLVAHVPRSDTCTDTLVALRFGGVPIERCAL
jgi:hypothetical protein